jgi:hypothetical protein
MVSQKTGAEGRMGSAWAAEERQVNDEDTSASGEGTTSLYREVHKGPVSGVLQVLPGGCL